MLLDGYHNRKRYGSIPATERKIFNNNVVTELTTTIGGDIVTCLSRMVASIKQTKGSARVNLDCAETHKLTLDRILTDQFPKNRSKSGGYSHQQAKSVKQSLTQQQWIPSVRGNLSRSYSVQQRKIDTSSKLKLRYQISNDNANSTDKRNRFNQRNNASRSNKADTSWTFGINKFSVASLLPILAYLSLIVLPISVDSAPSPPQQYGAHPIWLGEGLINLDQSLDSEQAQSLSQDDQDEGASSLEQALLNILTEKQQQQQTEDSHRPETLRRGTLKPSWSPFGREVLEDAIKPELQVPSAEQFWIQRRRLDRNRALEPPPWLREQPMRRGYNPRLLLEDDNLETTAEEDTVNLQDNAKKLIPGRKLRQSSDEAYDEVLRYLIEEAFQGQDFLNEIYDELERRSKLSPQSGLKPVGDSSLHMQLQPQLQLKIPNQQNTKSSGPILDRDDTQGFDQDNDPNSGLIVVGDEVSSGDGSTSVVEPTTHETHADIKAAYAQGLTGLAQSSLSPLFRDDDSMKSNAPTDQYGVPVRFENSLDTYEMQAGDSEPYQSKYSTYQEPFHVLEEIDRIDDLQSPSQQQPLPSYGNGDSSRSVGSNANWLSLLGAHGASKSSGLDNSEQLLSSKRDQKPSSGSESGVVQLKSGGGVSDTLNYGSDGDGPAKWFSQQARSTTRKSPKVGIALRMIESGYLNREQLVQVATKLKSHLEDMIGLMEGSILDLYPINPQQLLLKLDTSKLSALQIMDMIQKYDFARGFIVLSWPRGSQRNPMPILVAILDQLARNGGGGGGGIGSNVRPAQLPMDSTEQDDDSTLRMDTIDDDDDDDNDNISNRGKIRRIALNENDNNLMGTSSGMTKTMMDDDDDDDERPRIPLAALSALLGAIYARQAKVQEGVEQLPALAMESTPTSQPLVTAKDQQPLMSSPHLIQFSAIILALVGAFVAVKLAMKGQDSRMLLKRNLSSRSIRSFWSFGDGSMDNQPECDKDPSAIRTSDGQLSGGDVPSKDCTAGNPVAVSRHLAPETDSHVSCPDGDEHLKRKKNLEQLTRRLVSILSGFSHHRRTKTDLEGGGGISSNSSGKSDSGVSEDELQQQQTPYRSSRSYIKSLIDALSKARPFSSGDANEQDEPESKSALFGANPNVAETNKDAAECGGESSGSSDDGQLDHGVLLSQMDITAAHLILAYMETHLEDKERLRREWLQLNGDASPNSNSNLSSSKAKSGKMSEPILQRLAKVALNEENRHKNRDPSMVAFDRNRVKLNPGQQRTSQAKLRQRPASSSSRPLAGDYINASFIYDDDPSRPTHIIAQGPLEHTTGHFWQMIWEQGISVIVMLTRLNENSARQCHCYWPTGSSSSGSGSGQQSGPSGNVSPSPSPSQSLDDAATGPIAANGNAKQQSAAAVSNESTASARRGSVTSVFNMATVGRTAGQAGQPIIGNKDLLSNVISFDVCSLAASSFSSSASSSSSSCSSSAELVSASSGRTTAAAAAAAAADGPDSFDPREAASLHKSSKQSKKKQQQEVARNRPQLAPAKVIRFEIHLVSEHVSSNDYLVRNMCLVNRSTGETRTITQFHYLSWPDSGVPDNAKNLLQFRRKVHKSYRNLKSPILVHCSDGAGRSGTYTLIDIILERIRNGAKEIDPMATLVHLREQRVGLCANLSQFEFVLMALAEEIQIILDALPQ